ncbi:MAG TPA: hypothetical protein VNR89_17985 [Roseomonas sp.]|nr:hypothetical protein [Roseomonas sp.]
MRTTYALIGGLALMLAACGQSQTGGGMSGGQTAPMGGGALTAGTGTISPIQGLDDQPPRPGRGVPTAGTGTISPIQGENSVAPTRPGRGGYTAGTGTISPIQGQDDAGRSNVTRP